MLLILIKMMLKPYDGIIPQKISKYDKLQARYINIYATVQIPFMKSILKFDLKLTEI